MNSLQAASVAKLWRYPVKSLLGEECPHLDLDRRGVAGDRVFAIRDADGKLGSGKSTRHFRQIDGLFTLRAFWRGDAPEIVLPGGSRLAGDDPRVHEILSGILGHPVTMAREAEISHLDAGPVHILTTASLAWLRAALPDALIDERRFRPNILIDVRESGPVEQEWIGRTLRVGGEVMLRVSEATERCRMTTLAQSDLPGDPRVLRKLARDAGALFGVYAQVLVPGRIARGDPVLTVPLQACAR